MFTLKSLTHNSIRFFAVSFDKEGQPNIVEVAQGKKELPVGFPIDKFLEKYREWKKGNDSLDDSNRSKRQSLYAELRDMHQAAGLNKGTGWFTEDDKEMEIFGEFLEGLKGTRINNLSGAVFAKGTGPREGTAPTVAPTKPSLDIRYDGEYGDFFRRSRDFAGGKYILPTEGAYIQEPRDSDKAIVIWNKDKNTIHSIIVDGVQYIGQDGAFRNKDGKTITVLHDPAKKSIQVSFSNPVMAQVAPGAPNMARPAPGAAVMVRPVPTAPAAPAPTPLPAPAPTPQPSGALVVAPLEDKDEKAFQDVMKGVVFMVDGKEVKVLRIYRVGNELSVDVDLGNNRRQGILFEKTLENYIVREKTRDYYNVSDTINGGKRTIGLTSKSPTPDRAPPAAPAAPVPAPAPRPTAPVRVERTAEDVTGENRKYIETNQKKIDASLAKVQDAGKKALIEGFLKDPNNGNIRKLQELVGAKPDGDFRGLTLSALEKWAEVDAPARAPAEGAKPLPEIKVGQTLDEYIKLAEKAGHTVTNGLTGPQKDGSYIYLVNRASRESVYLYFEGGDTSKKIIKIEKRETPTTFKVGSDIGPAIDVLKTMGYEHDPKKDSTDSAGVRTSIFIKKDDQVFTIRHKDGKIVSVDNEKIVPAKKEVTKAELEVWKDKLGEGITWKVAAIEKDPVKIGDIEVKAYMNLVFENTLYSFVVVGETLYVWNDESKGWKKSEILEIRDGKIEKILPKKESIEDSVKKMEKVTLEGLGDAYKDITPEYDAEKKAIFLKAPFIDTTKGVIRNYIGISEDQFLAGKSVSTGTIAFVKGLYNVTITPVDGELVVKLDPVKPTVLMRKAPLTQAERNTKVVELFESYLARAKDSAGQSLAERIKRPDKNLLKWVDTKANDFILSIDTSGEPQVKVDRMFGKKMTDFENDLMEKFIDFYNQASRMQKDIVDTTDPYAELRKQLAAQLKVPPVAPAPVPAPAPTPASGAASAPPPVAPAPPAPAASGVRRDGDKTKY